MRWAPAAAAAFLTSTALAATPPGGALRAYPPAESWYAQAVDHWDFRTAAPTFRQKLLTYDKWWAPGAPIYLYLGNEGEIESFYNNSGLLFEIAETPGLGGLVLFVEHRYYGASLPAGGGSTDAPNLRYLTIEQALADFAVVLQAERAKRGCPPDGCP